MNRLTAQGLCFFVLFLLASGVSANAQETNTADKNKQTVTDETFTLNITESRVTETNFERSTQAAIGTENNSSVQVRVGANVRAQNIVITLRGITGNARFRASLEKIRRLLE